MPRKQLKSRAEALPIRSSSQIKEDESKAIFINLIRPWMVVSWMEQDFGIDALVEITRPIAASKDQIVTGKRISVQLKSSTQDKFDKKTFSLSISKEKINYWMQSFEPVILVYVDLNTSKAYYRWIDQDLIQELFNSNGDWMANDSVSVKFNSSFQVNAKSLSDIEKYALSWKRSSHNIISAGSYFKYSNDAYEYSNQIKDLCVKYNVRSLESEILELTKSISSSIYTISIIGLSRAGKSTLINALLEKDISPVGKLPTTGFPITILPRDENKVFITLENNKVIEGDANSKFLAEYSAQDKNPRNKKGVKHIRVHLVNNLLERGFALCDVPGLDDADTKIRGIAQTAILNSNAIIYVITLGGYSNGEFRINDTNIGDLTKLRGRIDRVFLVFNKVDTLTEGDLEEVKKYIDDTLNQFDVLNFLAAPPIFISSKEAYDRRMNNKVGQDSVSALEQLLWEFLINQDRTGYRRLMSNFSNEISLIQKLEKISKIRLESSDKRRSLEVQIANIHNALGDLKEIVFQKRERIYNYVENYTVNRFNNVLKHLSDELKMRTSLNSLPNSNEISEYLRENAQEILSDVHRDIHFQLFSLHSEVNSWIARKLNQVELSMDDDNATNDSNLIDIDRYTGQVSSFFITNNESYSGILESILSTIGQVIYNAFDKFVDLFIDDQKILQREINRMLKKSGTSYKTIHTQLLEDVGRYLYNISSTIFEKTRDRADVYLGELKNQASQLDIPLNSHEKENHLAFIRELGSLELEIKSQLNHLHDHVEGLDVFKPN